jgi:phosphoribosylformimino-5-aminoimidazole carboxamide ribotide isomerase
MLAIPAIDLRDAHCVQLVGGDYSKESVRLDDPVAVARQWTAAGFSRLHVVDLDAATGRGDNRDTIRDLLRTPRVPTQVGGGVREEEDVRRWLDEGADWIVIGTRGVEDPTWLAEQAALAPDRLILAADVKDRQVVTRGWATSTKRTVEDLVGDLEGIPLAGVLVTAVHKEGKMKGTDLALFDEVCAIAPWPVIASGGIGSMLDLRNLEDRGVSAVVLGMALYTGALDPRVVAEEYAA